MGDCLQAGKPSWHATSHPGQLSLLTSTGRWSEYQLSECRHLPVWHVCGTSQLADTCHPHCMYQSTINTGIIRKKNEKQLVCEGGLCFFGIDDVFIRQSIDCICTS